MNYTRKDVMQAQVLDQLADEKISIDEAARRLSCSRRTIFRKLKRFTQSGVDGLIHKNRGRVSSRKLSQLHEDKIVALCTADYQGAGATMVSELLQRHHGWRINRETVRKILKKHQLIYKRRKSHPYRRKRPRKLYFGEMLQLDGSFHPWFEDRGERVTLLALIDDATSRIIAMKFVPRENTREVLLFLKEAFIRMGVPLSIYSDLHSTYRISHAGARERGEKSSYEKALLKLGITPLHAYSPQAKGRVERTFGTHQDRLVIETRLRNISTSKEGNAYLPEYMAQHNARYAKPALCPESKFTMQPEAFIHETMTINTTRIVQNDHTVHHNKQQYQLHRDQPVRLYPKDTVTVREHLDGRIVLLKKDTPLNATLIDDTPGARQPHSASRPAPSLLERNLDSPLAEIRAQRVTKSLCKNG